jgi:hypothetical protein
MDYQIPPHLFFCTPGQNLLKSYLKNSSMNHRCIKRERTTYKVSRPTTIHELSVHPRQASGQVKLENEFQVIEPHKQVFSLNFQVLGLYLHSSA